MAGKTTLASLEITGLGEGLADGTRKGSETGRQLFPAGFSEQAA